MLDDDDGGVEGWMDSDTASREEITRICIPPDRDGRMRPRRREETEETEAAICLSQPSGVLSQDALLISLHFSQLLLLSPLDHLFSQLSLLSASHYFYKYLINIYITSFFLLPVLKLCSQVTITFFILKTTFTS